MSLIVLAIKVELLNTVVYVCQVMMDIFVTKYDSYKNSRAEIERFHFPVNYNFTHTITFIIRNFYYPCMLGGSSTGKTYIIYLSYNIIICAVCIRMCEKCYLLVNDRLIG